MPMGGAILGMALILASQARLGAVEQAASVVAGKTSGSLLIRPTVASLNALAEPVAMRVTVQQSPDDGATWFPVVGCESDDVRADCDGTLDRAGVPVDAIRLGWTEQVIRSDVWDRFGWTTKREIPAHVLDDEGRFLRVSKQKYYQLALLPTQKVSIDCYTYQWLVDGIPVKNYNDVLLLVAAAAESKLPEPVVTKLRIADAELEYDADFGAGDVVPAPVLLGRRSASLLGTLTGATGNTAGLDSGARDTTTGSLIIGQSGNERATTVSTGITFTDATGANTYTDQELTFTRIRFSQGYNAGGTRQAALTVTSTITGGTGTIEHTMQAAEYDGIKVSPTVVANTATGTGATFSGTVDITVTSLVVGLVSVNNTNRAPTVTVGTQAIQTNGNAITNVTMGYKVAQAAGTIAIGGTIADSQDWEMILHAFEEQPPATLEQEGFRWRDDDGNETTATWLANQDTSITRAMGVNTRLRVLVNATNDPVSQGYRLEYRRNPGSNWQAVVSGSGDIQLAASANIGASGAATTVQLTAPAGKSTSDFVAGRIQDDENPSDAVDITADDYTELEWCLQAVAGVAQPTFVYAFQVTVGGVPLTTISVTPTWTIPGQRFILGTH